MIQNAASLRWEFNTETKKAKYKPDFENSSVLETQMEGKNKRQGKLNFWLGTEYTVADDLFSRSFNYALFVVQAYRF